MIPQMKTKRTHNTMLKGLLCFLMIFAMIAIPAFSTGTAHAAGGINLSTTYPGITVKPASSTDFTISVANSTGTPRSVALSVKSMPQGWTGYFQGNGGEISRVYAKNGASSDVTFTAKAPDDVKEGTYKILLGADGGAGASDTLELELKVSQTQISGGKFTSQYPELQGTVSTAFKFSINLSNNSGKDQSYSLSSSAPEGWTVAFAPSYQETQIASLSVAAGKDQGLDVTVTPPKTVKAGKYTIPCSAVSAAETLKTDLVVNITGTYSMTMATPSGNLNVEATAGQESPVTLNITNTGSSDLKGISLSSSAPDKWTISFDPATVDIPANSAKQVKAYIKPGANIIAGDYDIAVTASNSAASQSTDFRVTVKTPTGWGIVAVIIIIALIVGLYFVFKKFGRR